MKLIPSRIFFFLAILSSILIALYFYRFVFDFYFFQDDWFNLNITRVQNLADYINFFKFRDNFIAYRPIALQNFFFILQFIFGLNALAYRVLNFAVLVFTYLLIINLSAILTKNKMAGLITGGLWITSSVHFMNLAIINYNLIGTFFYVATALRFLKKSDIWAFGLFLFTIGSYEMAATWPLVMGFYFWCVQKKNIAHIIKKLAPYLTIVAAYLLLRQIYISPPKITEYEIALNPDSAKALFWYVLWTFNIPEEFKKQITQNLIVFNGIFLRDYWPLVFKAFMDAAAFLLVGALLPLFKLVKNQKLDVQTTKFVAFGLIWFLITISPVLLLPNHNFIMYLTLPSIGIFMLISNLLILTKDKNLIILTTLIWLSLSVITLGFYKTNSYTVESQKTSKKFVQDIKTGLPYLPKNSVVFYPLAYRQETQSLLEQNAIQAVYKDTSLSIYYNKEALIKDLNYLQGRPIYMVPSQ